MNQSIILVQEEPRINSILVEILVPANAVQRVQCPDVQQLRSTTQQRIVIKSVALVTPKVLSHGILNGLVNAPITELRKIAFTMYSMGWERGQYIPILHLNNTADSDATTATAIPYKNTAPRFADWESVSWDKCYLQYANGQPSDGSSYTVMLEVQYLKFDLNGLEILGAS
jgi:hypothetical protein